MLLSHLHKDHIEGLRYFQGYPYIRHSLCAVIFVINGQFFYTMTSGFLCLSLNSWSEKFSFCRITKQVAGKIDQHKHAGIKCNDNFGRRPQSTIRT